MIPDTHLMKVIHTTKRVGFNTDQPIHKHDLYFTTEGDLVAEECDGGYCDGDSRKKLTDESPDTFVCSDCEKAFKSMNEPSHCPFCGEREIFI